MRAILSRFWADDKGAVISVEMILVIAILVFGIIPGLIALRNSINAFLGSIANIFAGLANERNHHHGGGGGTADIVVAQPIPPIDAGDIVISPAP
jgi:Flp pilus assembly pilin Flp